MNNSMGDLKPLSLFQRLNFGSLTNMKAVWELNSIKVWRMELWGKWHDIVQLCGLVQHESSSLA